MYDLQTIRQMNRKTGQQARKIGLQPLLIHTPADRARLPSIPNIGTFRPKGWRLVRKFFVDSSGFGQSGEPALTYGQFVAKTKVGMGYAIIETGQFQVYIGEFKRK